MKYWYNAHQQYRSSRRETIMHHIGSKQFAHTLGVETGKEMWGNLMQLSAQAHSIALAYNDPKFKCIANVPEADHVAPFLKSFLNRYSELMSMGRTARSVALDSFFGFGIGKVDIGILPPGVQRLVGQQTGPIFKRISQDNFIYDGDATCIEDMLWMADFYTVPLRIAKNFGPFLQYNPEDTANLTAWSTQGTRVDARIHQNPASHQSAADMTRLVDVYLPHYQLICTWAVGDLDFQGIEGRPLLVRNWTGHHSGPYEVMTHLDIPDNVIPVSQADSTKRLHILFNDLVDRTAHQAQSAKHVSVYETGSQDDMERIDDAEDRGSVGVTDINKIGSWSRPGPDQQQTGYMLAVQNLFKEFSGNLDDTLGLGPTAKTATQSQLIRQSTSARSADKRNRMNRFMQGIAYKLSSIVLADQTFRLPIRENVPGTDLPVDMSWEPPHLLPRNANSDDYQIEVLPYSMEYRDPAVRIAQLNEATTQIIQIMQAAAQGMPIDIKKYVEIQADYRDLPELIDVYNGLFPEHNERKHNAQAVAKRADVGQYNRTSESQASQQGAMAQMLTQMGGGNGGDSGGVQLNAS